MSFDVNIYTNYSEENKVDKELTLISTLTGDLIEDTSIINPSLRVATDLTLLSSANYIYIEKFKRYYFIDDITSSYRNISIINCRVDVLMSFKNYIRQNKGIISTQENLWNLYLNDNSLHCYQNPMILTKRFPSGFTTQEFILAVAGA